MQNRPREYVSYLVDRARSICRRQGHSRSTQHAYLHWIREFIDYCRASSRQLGSKAAQRFLDGLTDVTTSSRKQAHSALRLFLDEVVHHPLSAGEGYNSALEGLLTRVTTESSVSSTRPSAAPVGATGRATTGAFTGASLRGPLTSELTSWGAGPQGMGQ